MGTAGCAGEGEACCGGWCCPPDIYRQWRNISCISHTQCRQWMTGEYCCQDNKCCHTEEEDYRQEEEHGKEKEYSKEKDEKNLEEENILDKIYSVDKNDVRNQNIKNIRHKSLNQEEKEKIFQINLNFQRFQS